MSDSQWTVYGLDATGVMLYDAGLGVLTRYPMAAGDYLANLGSNSC